MVVNLLETKDSVFSPVIARFESHPFANDKPLTPEKEINSALDKLEAEFANRAMTLVSGQADKLVKSLSGKSIEEINKAKWDVVPRLQQLLWFLWRDGWKLGSQHAINEIAGRKVAGGRDAKFRVSTLATFDFTPDSTSKKRDRKVKVSKLLGNRVAAVPDGGVPLENSVLKRALEDRTLNLANDVDSKTLQEIKSALKDRVNKDKPISNDELEARINLALGRQVNRANKGKSGSVRTQIPKTGGGGFFSRAKLIARTELSGAYATARLESFRAAGITHIRWLSLEDLQRCARCASRHGMVVALSDVDTIAANPQPLHPNCRCLWVPLPNDEGGDKVRNDPNRNPGGMGLIPIAASWVLGKAISAQAKAIQAAQAAKIQKQKERDKNIRTLILGAGGALSLAGLYYLLLKTQPGRGITQDIAEQITQRASTSISPTRIISSIASANKTTNLLPVGNKNTPQEVLSPQAVAAFPELASADVDLSKISIRQLMQLTKLNRQEATAFKQEVVNWLKRKEAVTQSPPLALPASRNVGGLVINNIDINNASVDELVNLFGLTRANAVKVNNYINQGNRIATLEELRNIPGIGDRAIARVAASISSYRPNINTVPNTTAAANELAAQLKISPRAAKQILNERDANGYYTDAGDLARRVKNVINPVTNRIINVTPKVINRITQGADIIAPAASVSTDVRVGGNQEAPAPGFTPSSISSSPTPPRAVRVTPPSPEPISNPRLLEIDNNYQQLNNTVENYHQMVGGTIPRRLNSRIQTGINRQDATRRKQQQVYNARSESVAKLPDEIAKIEKQIEDMERGFEQFLNPLNDPYFDTANSSARSIARKAQELTSRINKLNKQDPKALAEIDQRAEELQQLKQELLDVVNSDSVNAARDSIRQQINNLQSQANRLGDSPQRRQLQEQIQALSDDLSVERDRNVQRINARIGELERLRNMIGEDVSGVKPRINDATAKLRELRDRLESLPKKLEDVAPELRTRYQQSQRLGSSQPQIKKQIRAYRTLESEANDNVQKIGNELNQNIAQHDLERQSAINNVAFAARRITENINSDMQLLRLMSGNEGVAWVLSKSQSKDAALARLQQQAGVRSINTIEEAAAFRDYAMGQLRGRVAQNVELLGNRLDAPGQITQKFIEQATAKSADIQELQKRVVVEGQNRARGIIEDMDTWQSGVESTLAGGSGKFVNQQFRDAKNQVIDEVTNRRINLSQNIKDTADNNQTWRESLTKIQSQEPVFEINNQALTKSQILEQAQNQLAEADSLRTIRQIDVAATPSAETLTRQQAIAVYKQRRDVIMERINTTQQQLADVSRRLIERQQAQGRRVQSTGRLEAEKRGVEQSLNQALQELEDLNQNRGFTQRRLKMAMFNKLQSSRQFSYTQAQLSQSSPTQKLVPFFGR